MLVRACFLRLRSITDKIQRHRNTLTALRNTFDCDTKTDTRSTRSDAQRTERVSCSARDLFSIDSPATRFTFELCIISTHCWPSPWQRKHNKVVCFGNASIGTNWTGWWIFADNQRKQWNTHQNRRLGEKRKVDHFEGVWWLCSFGVDVKMWQIFVTSWVATRKRRTHEKRCQCRDAVY